MLSILQSHLPSNLVKKAEDKFTKEQEQLNYLLDAICYPQLLKQLDKQAEDIFQFLYTSLGNFRDEYDNAASFFENPNETNPPEWLGAGAPYEILKNREAFQFELDEEKQFLNRFVTLQTYQEKYPENFRKPSQKEYRRFKELIKEPHLKEYYEKLKAEMQSQSLDI